MVSLRQSLVAKSLERLATGKRVNRASDDPAAVPAIDAMRARRATLEAGIKRVEQEAAYYGARDGLASVVSDNLVAFKGTIVQAANRAGITEDELNALRLDAQSNLDAIDFLANTYTYKGETVGHMYSTQALGIAGLAKSDLFRWGAPVGDKPDASIDSAIESLASSRAEIGNAVQDALSRQKTMQDEFINLSEAQSQIEDVDYAKETSELVRQQALSQVATFLAQMSSGHNAQTVMTLLQGVRAR